MSSSPKRAKYFLDVMQMYNAEKVKKYKNNRKAIKLGISKDDYVESYKYDNDSKKIVHLCLDDYGQCFYLVFMINGHKQEVSCGTYNFCYEECIEFVFKEIFKV